MSLCQQWQYHLDELLLKVSRIKIASNGKDFKWTTDFSKELINIYKEDITKIRN